MNYYNEIKKELINNENYKKVKDYSKNKHDLLTCYNVGKLLLEAGKHYGEGIIKEYSTSLTNELGKGYTPTRLKYYRRFFVVFSKSPTLSDLLTYSHYCEIIWFNENKINYYIKISIEENLSVRELRKRIKMHEYERLDEKAKERLENNNKEHIEDYIKNPILIKTPNKNIDVSERVLKQLILENIDSFLTELGTGFCYIKNEYKIRIGNRYNYIDVLLFNIKFNCYVVVELKVTELKKEHIGQIDVYMNYIDEHIKTINQNKTIGIIICKENNKFILKYASDKRIFETTYLVRS